ncbi:conserved protein of unknown function [Tepidanaerobacter acetatoxydans Re1]|uniref:DUF458 domain-containing protein n=1 Tax=Tepidanaerobacter acetatoxydans (strain DSM 21804 / JCM 16047 / Re1) TaxID=1209989 RepID=F4LRM5_TEPAE|nr:ribonuclease H-like YkuK family protein [Tepidanaerobacter acetatoxydans]AEE90288.1 protein of unknown function DUF458, RNase H-like protein [Tepidanaerobacter acetatoxydans Re1]CCP24764.1 conserved protein of unknown function [Tepidanaerobacter acetatoxydans Re1]
MNFINPTKGKMSIQEMVQDIVAFMEEEPSTSYKLIIGTDSQSREESCFVTAVIIHRVGKGARYYYYRKYMSHVKNLRHKIFTETSMSLDAVTQLKEEMSKTRYKDMDVEIHVDIGQNGDTKELIREVVGWVMGSGFKVKIKPDACGATKVADKYTK